MSNLREKTKSALRARADYEYFTRLVLRDDAGDPLRVAKHQAKWIEACQDIGDHPQGALKYLIIAPPGAGKTVLIAVGFTGWMIGKSPLSHLGLISYADKVAWGRGGAIRRLIEHSRMYRFVFPGLDDPWLEELRQASGLPLIPVEPDKSSWGSSEFRLMRENLADPHPTLRCGGATSSIVSYRLSGLIIDDPHDIKNSSNVTQRKKVVDTYDNAVSTRAVSEAWQLGIGTRWADDDLIGQLIRRGGWEVIHIPALNKTGRSYWESAYPTKTLLEKRFMTPDLFEMQYMGDTKGGKSSIIKKLVTYEGEVTLERGDATRLASGGKVVGPLTIYIDGEKKDLLVAFGIDTAMKDKQKNDYTVNYIGGLDPGGKIWILDRIKGRYGLPELVTMVSEQWEKWSPWTVWVEDAASGTPAVQQLRVDTPLVPTELVPPTQGGKTSRAFALTSFLHTGAVVFPKSAPWFEDAEFFLLRVGHAQYDDDLDALYVLVSNLMGVRHPKSYDDPPLTARLDMR